MAQSAIMKAVSSAETAAATAGVKELTDALKNLVAQWTASDDKTKSSSLNTLGQNMQKTAQGILQGKVTAQQASEQLKKFQADADAAASKVSAVGQEIDKDLVEPFGQAMQKTLTGLIQGTVSARQALASLGQNFLQQEVSQNGKRLESWAETEARKTLASAASLAERGALEAAGAAKSIALSAATGLKDIAVKAAQAAAGAYAALSGIPYVGPFLAPAAAAAALGAVIALGRGLASAEGGWDRVPADGMLTELHKNEVVLPSSIASPLRSAIDAGSFGNGAAGGGGAVNLHYAPSISGGAGWGSRADAESFFRNHGDLMIKTLKNAYRNGALGA